MKLRTIIAIWFALQATAAVAVAAEPDPAIANRHRAAEQLAYQVQAIRDRIGIQCRRLGWPRADDCEMANYTSYYKILDGIKNAENSSDALIAISQIIAKLEAEVSPKLLDLERSMAR